MTEHCRYASSSTWDRRQTAKWLRIPRRQWWRDNRPSWEPGSDDDPEIKYLIFPQHSINVWTCHWLSSYVDGEVFELVGVPLLRATLEHLDLGVGVNLKRVRKVEQGFHPVHDETVVEDQRFHGRGRTIPEISQVLIGFGTFSDLNRVLIISSSPEILVLQFCIVCFSTLPRTRTPWIGRFCRWGIVRLCVRSVVTMSEDRRNASGRRHVRKKANHLHVGQHCARLKRKHIRVCI